MTDVMSTTRKTKKRKARTLLSEGLIDMYAHGMSVRKIQGDLLEVYGLQVSPNLIS